MSDMRNKILNYKSALLKLKEGISKFDEGNDLLRDGLIQRFEFAFELAWKTLKAIFEDEGLRGLNSPKTVLREAFAAELIDDDEVWLDMLSDRNTNAHIYSEKLSVEICNNIKEKYVVVLEHLIERISNRIVDIVDE